MKSTINALSGAALVTLATSGAIADEEIPVADVPTAAIEAAESEVPGFQAEEAEMEIEDGQTVYELEGKANGIEYEIEVTAEGQVLEVEEDD